MFANKKLEVNMAELRKRLRYCPDTGAFFWTSATGNRKFGERAGFQKNDQYVRICFMRKTYLAHNLAWAMTYGYIPALQIDHINRDRSDNRIANLRLATISENCANRNRPKSRAGKVSAALGATRLKHGRWQAQIYVNGRNKYLGSFDTAEAATAAYRLAMAERGFP